LVHGRCCRQPCIGDQWYVAVAMALQTQSYVTIWLEDADAVEALSQEGVALGQALQDDWIQGHAYLQLAYVARACGKQAEVKTYFQRSLAAFQADGQSVMRGIPAMRLGELLYEQNDYTGAQRYFHYSLSIFEELSDPARTGYGILYLGKLAMAQGNLTATVEHPEFRQYLAEDMAEVAKTIRAIQAVQDY